MAAVTLEKETTVKDETTLESIKDSLLKLDETSLHEVSQVVNSFLVVQKVKSGLEKVGQKNAVIYAKQQNSRSQWAAGGEGR